MDRHATRATYATTQRIPIDEETERGDKTGAPPWRPGFVGKPTRLNGANGQARDMYGAYGGAFITEANRNALQESPVTPAELLTLFLVVDLPKGVKWTPEESHATVTLF